MDGSFPRVLSFGPSSLSSSSVGLPFPSAGLRLGSTFINVSYHTPSRREHHPPSQPRRTATLPQLSDANRIPLPTFRPPPPPSSKSSLTSSTNSFARNYDRFATTARVEPSRESLAILNGLDASSRSVPFPLFFFLSSFLPLPFSLLASVFHFSRREFLLQRFGFVLPLSSFSFLCFR